jgi:hypothetical protein
MPPEENRPSPTGSQSFDELARGLASGSVSRRQALKLLGGAFLGGLLASIPGAAFGHHKSGHGTPPGQGGTPPGQGGAPPGQGSPPPPPPPPGCDPPAQLCGAPGDQICCQSGTSCCGGTNQAPFCCDSSTSFCCCQVVDGVQLCTCCPSGNTCVPSGGTLVCQPA